MRRIPLVFGAVALLMLASPLPSAATFPGVNGRIAFGDFAGRQIFSIQPDGGGRMRLTHTAHRVNSQPAWSADGSQIVYVRQTANFHVSELVVMGADGSNPTSILTTPFRTDYVLFLRPVWSPDGSHIAFCAAPPRGRTKIFVVQADGSNPVKLSGGRHNDCSPDWSSNGDIAFIDFEGRHDSLLTMNADGTDREVLGRTGFSLHPSWSPDGDSIVFERSLPDERRTDIWVVGADGSGLAPLTDSTRRWEFTPVYSPEGGEIAFVRGRGPRLLDPGDIWIMHADGSMPTQITDNPKPDEYVLSWQSL